LNDDVSGSQEDPARSSRKSRIITTLRLLEANPDTNAEIPHTYTHPTIQSSSDADSLQITGSPGGMESPCPNPRGRTYTTTPSLSSHVDQLDLVNPLSTLEVLHTPIRSPLFQNSPNPPLAKVSSETRMRSSDCDPGTSASSLFSFATTNSSVASRQSKGQPVNDPRWTRKSLPLVQPPSLSVTVDAAQRNRMSFEVNEKLQKINEVLDNLLSHCIICFLEGNEYRTHTTEKCSAHSSSLEKALRAYKGAVDWPRGSTCYYCGLPTVRLQILIHFMVDILSILVYSK
jgi:hypothetical protein